MRGPSARSLEKDDSVWLSERARRATWCTLVAFAVLDWTYPLLALTQEWWSVLLVLWIVPWERATPAASSFMRAARCISALILFAWLISRTEKAARESVSTWILFRSSAESHVLSYAWHATVAALVTSVVSVVPLRRVLGEQAAGPTAVLACLPYSVSLATHFSSFSLRPLAVPVVVFAVVIPGLAMAAVTCLLRRFAPDRQQKDYCRQVGTAANRMLKGQLKPFELLSVFALYGAALVVTLWCTTSWVTPGIPLPATAPSSTVYTLTFPLVLSVLVLSSFALWRRLHSGTRRTFITENLKTLARGLIVITLVPAVLAGFFLALPYTGQVISDTVQESSGPGWSILPSESGHLIRISGEIQSGLSDAVAEVLETTPGVKRLELESPGGSVTEGLALAELVEKYSLDTAVTTFCDSACTLIFVAGRERVLGAGAALGFHRCRSRLWYYALLYDDHHNTELAHFFRSKGISQAFADKVISVSSDRMWFPTVDQLLAAGVLTAAQAPDEP